MIELTPQSFVLAALGLAFGLPIGWLVARPRTHAAEVPLATGAARVAFWGAVAMVSTALVGRLFGTSVQ